MDNKDRQIIRELQQDGRLTNHELAARVNLSPSPCLRRVRNLEQSGVIKGYTALVDQKAFGLPVICFVRVRLVQHSKESVKIFEDAIELIEEIQDCYLMTGDCDYLLKIIVEDLEAYETLVRTRIHNIAGVASMDTGFAYGKVKQSRVFPWPDR
ncbi:MAG: Lrp/AsnC family transcriptional regulator [Kordiimonadaceae bacterium]|nr:Lrp/AsnC family transcriptional regulator [Kordiimonadaceae bacterium]